jgi:hypothetical protein
MTTVRATNRPDAPLPGVISSANTTSAHVAVATAAVSRTACRRSGAVVDSDQIITQAADGGTSPTTTPEAA